MAPTVLNYSKICHIYNIYNSNNRGVNKKEGVIVLLHTSRQLIPEYFCFILKYVVLKEE